MKIVTSGLTFLDIDAYGGCIAYAELLRLMGEDAIAFSSATMNESITETIRSWDVAFSSTYVKKDDDRFVLIDVSELDYLDKYVEIDKVIEVIDHHVGFEEYWQNRIGDKANIEFIGAACTQVYEKWAAASLLDKMSETSARLLISGILDNTLNFEANVTTPRDKTAYDELLKIANLPHSWNAEYFGECQESIFSDVQLALENDTKIMQFRNIEAGDIAFGQLVIWNAEKAVNEHLSLIEQTMEALSNDWLVNIVSIDEGVSYFLSSNDKIETWAEEILNIQFSDNLAKADRLWLRKEVFKEDQSYSA